MKKLLSLIILGLLLSGNVYANKIPNLTNSIWKTAQKENKWRNSELVFLSDTEIKIKLKGKFTTERGRINCSLNVGNGFFRWFGVQFVVKEK